MSIPLFNPIRPDDPRMAVQVANVSLADAATAGGVAAIANPLGVALIILRVLVRVLTVATAAATVDAGVAANGTTLSDTLIDGLDVNAAAGLFDNIENKGANGKARQVWGATQYVTVSQASGDVADLEGELYIEYIRA